MSHLRCPDNGKIGYLTEHEANRALRKARHQRKQAHAARRYAKGKDGLRFESAVTRQERRVYECNCGLWHLTSKRYVDVSDYGMGA